MSHCRVTNYNSKCSVCKVPIQLEPISELNGDQCRADGSRSGSVGQTEARYPGNGRRKGVMRDFEALLLRDAFKQRRSEDSNQGLIKQQLIVSALGVDARPSNRAPAGNPKGDAREGASPTQVCSSTSGLISRCLV